MSRFLTTQNAAGLLNCTEQYVRKLIRTGQIPASRHGRTWLIPEETLHSHRMKNDLEIEDLQNILSNNAMVLLLCRNRF